MGHLSIHLLKHSLCETRVAGESATKLLAFKKITSIVNFRTHNSIDQLPELILSAIEQYQCHLYSETCIFSS